MKTYSVFITKTHAACEFVEANSASEAINIADTLVSNGTFVPSEYSFEVRCECDESDLIDNSDNNE